VHDEVNARRATYGDHHGAGAQPQPTSLFYEEALARRHIPLVSSRRGGTAPRWKRKAVSPLG